VPPLIEAFNPDIIVSQLGVDTFRSDPLTHLNYTTNGFCAAVDRIKAMGKKWVALGGGGYDLSNVARAWTLAWAIMNDAAIPGQIPPEFLLRYKEYRFPERLEDEPFKVDERRKEQMRKEVQRVIDFIKGRISFKEK
jgi:acetoin utilization protein AcuC